MPLCLGILLNTPLLLKKQICSNSELEESIYSIRDEKVLLIIADTEVSEEEVKVVQDLIKHLKKEQESFVHEEKVRPFCYYLPACIQL